MDNITLIRCIISTHMWMKDAMNIVSLFLISFHVHPSSPLHCLIRDYCVRYYHDFIRCTSGNRVVCRPVSLWHPDMAFLVSAPQNGPNITTVGQCYSSFSCLSLL